MDDSKYEAFLLAVDHGSLTAAAEFLGYTQSGITRIIKSLEDEVGFPLFIRSKKGVRLTENGKVMVPLFREIHRAIQNARQTSADICGNVCGTLSIGSYFSIASSWLPIVMKGFQELYPGVSVSLYEGTSMQLDKLLNEKAVDCCFCSIPRTTRVDWIHLIDDEIVAWVPKDHPAAAAGFFSVADLEKEPFIHTHSGEDTELDNLIQKLNLKPNVRFTTNNAFTTYNMVAAGLGISLDQKLRASQWNGEVAEIPFSPRQFEPLGIAVPSINEASPAAKKFIKYARTINYKELI